MIMCISDNAREMFYSVYKEYRSQLPGYANYFLNDREEARDISSETFIKLWLLRESFPSTDNMRSFVKVCTRNACLNQLKKAKRQQRRNFEFMQHYCPPVTAEVCNAEAACNEDALIRAIRSLDPKSQQCILLYYYKKMTCAGIAARLNIKKRTVKFYLNKGRGIIRSVLSANQPAF